MLPPWLFYDATGSALFDEITKLPEYYVSRLERSILRNNARNILSQALNRPGESLRIIELGAGSAEKTSILLSEAQALSKEVVYVPIDISFTALEGARRNLELELPGVKVKPIVSDYVSSPIRLDSFSGVTIALYIGSSIGNFEPHDARAILGNLKAQLNNDDALLLGTDLVKSEHVLIPAYDDARGVTAAFNKNVLRRLNAELQADFLPELFAHRAVWNGKLARMEMHLESLQRQRVTIPRASLDLEFAPGETIHTENSYKYTPASIRALLDDSGFTVRGQWKDDAGWYAVTLASPTRND